MQRLPLEFVQDAINPNIFSLFDCETGELTRTTREACEGLERCSIWYDNHIECNSLKLLEPFGESNEMPIFIYKNLNFYIITNYYITVTLIL